MSKLPWFRMYTEAVDDEKLRLLAFEDRWHFIALLCCKGQGILDADDPLLMRKVAVKLGLDVRSLEEVARRLAEIGLIDETTLQPVRWDDRQMHSDSSTSRVRAYRDRLKRSGNVSETVNETSDETGGTVSVTAQEVEVDTEEETDKPSAEVKEERSSAAPTSAARGVRLSKDWKLPRVWGEWALAEQPTWSADHTRRIAEKFRDHWVAEAGAKGRKADWEATWRNWVRREGPMPGIAGQPGQQGPNRQEALEQRNRLIAAQVAAEISGVAA